MTRLTTKVQRGVAIWVDEGDNEGVNEVTMRVTTGEKKFEDEVDNESANGERLTRVLTK